VTTAAARGRATVLIVEDDHDARATCADALRRAGFEVVEAAAVWQAKERAMENALDLVIVDRRLPDGDGLDLVRRWRDKDAKLEGVPIIMLTGHATRADVEAALIAGCDAFLAKPCPVDVLVDHIRRAIIGSRPTRKITKAER
jgi:DNA-binding response OmpR family regulator